MNRRAWQQLVRQVGICMWMFFFYALNTLLLQQNRR
jgi:hypothetical protein